MKLNTDLLVTAAIVPCGDVEIDRLTISDAAHALSNIYAFYEVLVISPAPDPNWLHAIEDAIAGISNVRLLVLDDLYDFEVLALAALNEAIGDYVAVIYAGEATANLIPELLTESANGADIVKVKQEHHRRSLTETLLRGFAAGFYWVSEYRVAPDVLRSMCVSRSGINAINQRAGNDRYFRFLDFDTGYRQAWVKTKALRPRRSLRDHFRRLLVGLELLGHAVPRLLKILSLLAFAVSLISFGYGFYALALWLFKSHVMEGWASVSVVLSLMFGTLFLTLGVVCVGISRLIEVARQRRQYVIAREINRSDLFGKLTALNVEVHRQRNPSQ